MRREGARPACPTTPRNGRCGVTDNLWGEVPTTPAEPLSFQTERKALLSALSRTQHALGDDDKRPVLQSWWLVVDGDLLTVHTADNYRLARAVVDVSSSGVGLFGIHRSEGKALLAFLASGPPDLIIDVSGGAWSVSHDEGRLTGRLSPGSPPDWAVVTHRDAAVTTLALNGRLAADAAKAATGESGIVMVDLGSSDRPTLFRSDGYDEWVMPVRIGGGAPVETEP